MKVTYNWLKDFVDITLSPRILADKLIMAGLEVGSIEPHHNDFVFEIEITSNRPDWLSVIGIAREVAAITGKRLKRTQERKSLGAPAKGRPQPAVRNTPVSIVIENKTDCPLYTAKIVTGVKIGPSPDWLINRLAAVGCRSINNVVDITNYIMFEYGTPLHAFDLDRLNSDTIGVRRARPGEKLNTIDAKERTLDSGILVITDKENPVALAGIMGGKDTEVSADTRNVLLEAAVFGPVIIRRGRQKLGIQTESAYRFERAVNPGIVEEASLRAVKLIQELAGGEFVSAKSSGRAAAKSKKVQLDITRVQRLLGVNISAAEIQKILRHLEFGVKPDKKADLEIEIPFFRQDVKQEADLVEEIARIFGYENIPPTIPMVAPRGVVSGNRALVAEVKDILAGLGLHEVITCSLIDKESIASVRGCVPDSTIEIQNPLSREQEVMVSTLMPGMLRCVVHNLNQKQEYIGIFEVNRAFGWTEGRPKEELCLAVVLCGVKSWFLGQGAIKDSTTLLHVKGIVESLFERLGIKAYRFDRQKDAETITVFAEAEKIGTLERVNSEVLDKFDIKNKDIFLAGLSLEKLFSRVNLNRKFVPLPEYPGISRDISLILKEEIPAGDVLNIIKKTAGPLLQEMKITDYYKGEQIPPGFKGLTITCLYRSGDRTLTEPEINSAHTQICAALTDTLGAKLR